jgi:hypothetical protein
VLAHDVQRDLSQRTIVLGIDAAPAVRGSSPPTSNQSYRGAKPGAPVAFLVSRSRRFFIRPDFGRETIQAQPIYRPQCVIFCLN